MTARLATLLAAMRRNFCKFRYAVPLALVACCGCALWPDRIVQPQYHNPFPQLHRVAVLPFYNQSAEPTVNGEEVAIAYYNELQAIPGFEVMPVGVAKQMLAAAITATGAEPRTGEDFQRLAQLLGVDAVIVGAVTDYSPYYPPRLGLAVDWYAANPGFHPIPPGYGLPWGRAEEEFIPSALVREAEFALAREQLKTQTPPAQLDSEELPAPQGEQPQPPLPPASVGGRSASATALPNVGGRSASATGLPNVGGRSASATGLPNVGGRSASATGLPSEAWEPVTTNTPKLPPDWPDPRGFIPPPPGSHRPLPRPQHAPIITHTRIYHGQDAKFTERLATYYYLRDDARHGGWTGYLQRPDDFVRFCCYLHVTETLGARGGAGEAQVLWRWPISRYER